MKINRHVNLSADLGFRGGQWPESYITWEFLEKHPKAMEPGYLNLDWNHILGLFNWKGYMRTLVIPPADLQRLCNPANLESYWEPSQDPKAFHTTLVLAFIREEFHDCEDKSRKKELVWSVAVVRKPAHFSSMIVCAGCCGTSRYGRGDSDITHRLAAQEICDVSRLLL